MKSIQLSLGHLVHQNVYETPSDNAHIDMVCILGGSSYVSSDLILFQSLADTSYICRVSLQCEFSCEAIRECIKFMWRGGGGKK